MKVLDTDIVCDMMRESLTCSQINKPHANKGITNDSQRSEKRQSG